MPYVSFLPIRESELVTWSAHFNAMINANPGNPGAPGIYGLTAEQAAAYSVLHNDFVAAHGACNSNATNSRSATTTKNTAKKALLGNARMLSRIVQTFPGMTNTLRSELGLSLRRGPGVAIPAPAAAPGLEIVAAMGHTVRIRLVDAAGGIHRGKPDGVYGASVFTFVGAQPPASVAGWKFQCNTTRTIVDVPFDLGLPPGAVVWFTAFWYNPRAQSGPGCSPVSALIAGGQMQQAA